MFKTDIAFKTDVNHNFLPFITAFMVFLASITFATALIGNNTASDWDKHMSNNLTIQVLPNMSDKKPQKEIEDRIKTVETFWKEGILNPNSNVQFGEGGAGTFSDGKLNTLTKDTEHRHKKVLEIFVQNGAPKEILYLHNPHIGTDVLVSIIKNIKS